MADDLSVQNTSDPAGGEPRRPVVEPATQSPDPLRIAPPATVGAAAPSIVHRHPVAAAVGAGVVGLLIGAIAAGSFIRFFSPPPPGAWGVPPAPPGAWFNAPPPGWVQPPPPPPPPPPRWHPPPPPWAWGPPPPPPPGGPAVAPPAPQPVIPAPVAPRGLPLPAAPLTPAREP
jgi:hypothetical protein